MTDYSYHKKDTIKETVKRYIYGILWQIPWLSGLFGLSWYIRQNSTEWLSRYFDLFVIQKNAVQLEEKTQLLKESLSLSNPLRYADYLSALSSSTFAKAKASTLEQTIQLLSGFFNGFLTVIWIIALFIAIKKVFAYVQQKSMENEIANAVVEKILPVLLEHQKSLSSESNKSN